MGRKMPPCSCGHCGHEDIMDQIFSAADIGSAIQSALAPVFLLTAIAGLLNVLVHRL